VNPVISCSEEGGRQHCDIVLSRLTQKDLVRFMLAERKEVGAFSQGEMKALEKK
jgi:hypothetical protein